MVLSEGLPRSTAEIEAVMRENAEWVNRSSEGQRGEGNHE